MNWQINLTGSVKETKRGVAICFSIPLGFIRLVCIVHIPEDDEGGYSPGDKSNIYVKCVNPREDMRVRSTDNA